MPVATPKQYAAMLDAFPAAMKKLKELDLINPIIEAANKQKYLLGICLGMQLLFTNSEEFEKTEGLDLIKGNIIKLDKFNNIENQEQYINTLEENMKISKELLAECAELDIILEIEAGVVGGEEDGHDTSGIPAEKLYTTP